MNMTQKNCAILFGRDDPAAGSACLEYSWVPTGRRMTLQLPLGQNVASRVDQVDTDITQLQVYSLVDGNLGISNVWYLPPNPDKSIAFATIYVSGGEVVGTEQFTDGTSVQDKRLLKSNPLPCPTPP
jgi:hypothetical protein